MNFFYFSGTNCSNYGISVFRILNYKGIWASHFYYNYGKLTAPFFQNKYCFSLLITVMQTQFYTWFYYKYYS